jgi:hypothetical protein
MLAVGLVWLEVSLVLVVRNHQPPLLLAGPRGAVLLGGVLIDLVRQALSRRARR